MKSHLPAFTEGSISKQTFHKSIHVCACLTLCDPLDCGPPGSPIHGISQVRILEWGAMPFCSLLKAETRGSRQRNATCGPEHLSV